MSEAAERTVWTFVGNDAAVANLVHSIAAGRVSHAFLIAGPPGIGKRTLARLFARALLCASPPAPGLSCGTCLPCRKIERSVHPDVEWFDLTSQSAAKGTGKNTTITIETVRALASQAALRPLEGRWRVTVLDDAELMQTTAQEALLKTVEEPPPFTVMMLLATDAEALLPTIRSRCQTVELRPVPRGAIRSALVAQGMDSELAGEIAGLAGGAPGWALQAAATRALVDSRLAEIDEAVRWVEADGYHRLVRAIRLGDDFTKRRQETFAELEILLGLWRDLLLLSAGQRRFVSFRTRTASHEALAGQWGVSALHRALCSVRQCIADLEANVRPRLALAAMVLQWPTP